MRAPSWAFAPCRFQGPFSLPPSSNFICSLPPGFGGRRGTEWNRNSMWGTSPLIH